LPQFDRFRVGNGCKAVIKDDLLKFHVRNFTPV
jgi:hypothetical protein